MNTDPRIQALIIYLSCDSAEDITPSRHTDNVFDVYGQEWLVLTDEEADEAAEARVADDLWAFNAPFVLGQCRLDTSDAVVRAFTKMQGEPGEGATPVVRALSVGPGGLADCTSRGS